MSGAPEIAEKRARLAEVERGLGRLRHQHDIAMSAFLFEEATALGREIALFEKEQQALAAALPATAPEGPIGIVPTLAGPRRRQRARRGTG